jgi:integrase
MELTPMEIIEKKLTNRYQASGFTRSVILTDLQIIRRIGVHPALATVEDLENNIVLRATKQSAKANYVARLRSIYGSLNKMGLVNGNNPAEDLAKVKVGRSSPKPVTKAEYAKLLEEAEPMFRDWFILGGMAGLRCCEAAVIKGADLFDTDEGPMLTVIGKGNTDLVIPVSPMVAETIRKYDTLGRLWNVTANKFSAKAANEMRRILGPDAKHFHSLRHYFATDMLERSGGDLVAVKELMRHTSVATTQVYTQLAHGRTRSLVNLLK